MEAYDLWFESEGGIAVHPGGPPSRSAPSSRPDGWIGSAGPGIDSTTWPRGALTGLPMFHVLTLRLPEAYRRRGTELPGIAFFQGEGQFAEPRSRARRGLRRWVADPFERDVSQAADHPHLLRRTDVIDGQFALVWLDEDELAAGPTEPPPDTRRVGEHVADDGGPNAWDTRESTRWVWLLVRNDPNAGRAPVDPLEVDAVPGYVSPFTQGFRLNDWANAAAPSHLGGTSKPVQALARGFTPFYLELDQLPGVNFGEGRAQLDLESDAFDWACD